MMHTFPQRLAGSLLSLFFSDDPRGGPDPSRHRPPQFKVPAPPFSLVLTLRGEAFKIGQSIMVLNCQTERQKKSEFLSLSEVLFDDEEVLRMKLDFVEKFFFCAAALSPWAGFKINKSKDLSFIKQRLDLEYKFEDYSMNDEFALLGERFKKTMSNSTEKMTILLTFQNNLKQVLQKLQSRQSFASERVIPPLDPPRNRIKSEQIEDSSSESHSLEKMQQKSLLKRVSSEKRPFTLVSEAVIEGNLIHDSTEDAALFKSALDLSHFELTMIGQNANVSGFLKDTNLSLRSKRQTDEANDLDLGSVTPEPRVEKLYKIAKFLKASFLKEVSKQNDEKSLSTNRSFGRRKSSLNKEMAAMKSGKKVFVYFQN